MSFFGNVGFLIFIFFVQAQGVIDSRFFEGECRQLAAQKWPKENKKFFANDKDLFYPMMHRVDMNRMAASLYDKPIEDLEEDALFYDACIKINLNFQAGKAHLRGYGKEDRFALPTAFPGNYSNPPDIATMYLTLSDDSTFAVFFCCTHDNQRTWFVVSTAPELPPAVVSKVRKYVEEMGFSWQYAAKIRYSCGCPK